MNEKNKDDSEQSLVKKLFQKIRDTLLYLVNTFLFRLEFKINDAVFSSIKLLGNNSNKNNYIVKKIFEPLKLIGNTNINLPILNIYFK